MTNRPSIFTNASAIKRKLCYVKQLRQNEKSDTSFKAVFLSRWIADLEAQYAKLTE